jgi:hypothetical protein
MRLGDGELYLGEAEACPGARRPADGAVICVSREGEVWISSKAASARLIPAGTGKP